MAADISQTEPGSRKPISIGLTCWLWQWRKTEAMFELAKLTGVRLELKQHWHGLKRTIEGTVSGENVDRFIGEFARRC